ncbi:hypothetical protein GCM10010387_60150 [Streptomyces inusitatus]|uniref:Uncharacterized protein n=1 Tax=Streptomyces inusitatus TaxID=68221 RepID=A0A918V2E6_9ACTN|nr:hypothetical protein [Streptomyces inusitatus]GGZ58225.1 hypothetical protein GCM10010387_60150 [Streptomyces inusitatus]
MSSDQQYPYGQPQHQQPQPQPQPHQPQPYQGQYDPYQGQYQGQPQYQPQPQQQYQDPYAPQQDGAAQTWEGETWDTQYQPTITPEHHAPPAPAAEETAYLPPVRSGPPVRTGSHALPPENPAAAYAPPAPAPAAPAPEPPAGYSAPTMGGNARITDAQRARAEGRSPIIPPGIEPAALTAGLGLLLAVGAGIGAYGLLVPLVLLQAVTAAGWFRLNGMWPARQGIALAFAGGLVADAVLLGVGKEHAPAAILGTLGIWVLLILVLQLRSAAGADERMQGLMATVVSAALAVLAAGFLAAADHAVITGGIAVAAAVVVRALPLPAVASMALALLAGAGAGLAAGGMTAIGSQGALLGLVAGALALVGLRVASYDYPSRFVHFTAGVALPLTAAAPGIYLLGRVLAP